MITQFKLFTRTVVGVQAAKSLAQHLISESAFFQVTPLPDDEYEFSVRDDRRSLLVSEPVDIDSTATDTVSGDKNVHSLKLAPYVAVFEKELCRYEVFNDDDLMEYVGSACTLSDCEALAKVDFES